MALPTSLKDLIDEEIRQQHHAIAECLLAELAKHMSSHRERILQIVCANEPCVIHLQPRTPEDAEVKNEAKASIEGKKGTQEAENGLHPCKERRTEPGAAPERQYHGYRLRQLAGINQGVQDLSVLGKIVGSTAFEVASAVLIVALVVVMCAEGQYQGMDLGFKLNINGYDRPGSESWPNAQHVFDFLDVFFNVMFTIEFALRVIVYRLESVKSWWLWLDLILLFQSWVNFFAAVKVGLDPMLLRMLRLIRLLRLLKVFETFKYAKSLLLLVKSIESSFPAMLWCFLLLVAVQTASGIALCQLLRGFIDDESKPVEVRRQVFAYFGTTSHAFLTMFEIVIGNWVTTCRLLYVEVSEWYALFYLLYRCCFMFAITRVITAVFIAETSRNAASNDEYALVLKHRQKEDYCARLKEVFTELDEVGDGALSWGDLKRLFSDDVLQSLLDTLEIDVHDLRSVFELLDEGHKKIDFKEFVGGLTKVRGPAKSLDVLKLLKDVSKIEGKLNALMATASKMHEQNSGGGTLLSCELPSPNKCVQTCITTDTTQI